MAFHYWKQMAVCHRAIIPVAQACLSFALKSGAISSAKAIEMMAEIRAAGRHLEAPGTPVVYAVIDFEGAMNNLETSKADNLAEQFDEQLVLTDLTTQNPDTTI
jgi:hypothetical protein